MADTVPVRDERSLRSGSTSQGLLLTLIGDYWFGQPVYIPSAALVDLLAEFGISAQAARAALSRVQRAGYLIGERDGRHTLYRLSPESASLAVASGRRIMRFTADRPERAEPWSGTWTIVTYALQTDQIDERRQIRRELRGLGFGGLQDGVWISPRVSAERVERVLDAGNGQLAAVELTVFDGARLGDRSAIDIDRVWRLDDLADRYRTLNDQFQATLRRIGRRTRLQPAEALVMRTEAMQEWRKMPVIDPRLPNELLPRRWPGWRAREMFTRLYDELGERAAEHVREVVRPHSVEAADAIHHDTVARPR